jgi:hypothetical protein
MFSTSNCAHKNKGFLGGYNYFTTTILITSNNILKTELEMEVEHASLLDHDSIDSVIVESLEK